VLVVYRPPGRASERFGASEETTDNSGQQRLIASHEKTVRTVRTLGLGTSNSLVSDLYRPRPCDGSHAVRRREDTLKERF